MKNIFAIIISLLSISSIYAQEGVKPNKEGQIYNGLNIGQLHSPGWQIIDGPKGFTKEKAPKISIDSSGVRLGNEWLGHIYFDEGKLIIKNKDKKHQLVKGQSELGFKRVKLILSNGRVVHFGRMSC